MNRLRGKRAFITAAGAGIGKATALAFAEERAEVIATDLKQELLADLKGKATAYALDVRDTAAVNAMAEKVGGLPRVRNGQLCLGLAAHADAAVLPALVVKNRSRSTAQIFAATFAGSSVASISTQRSGSSLAICR